MVPVLHYLATWTDFKDANLMHGIIKYGFLKKC